MADIAVSAAALVVQIVDTVSPFLLETKPTCRQQLQTIDDWLQTMKAYLKDTEGKEGNEGMRNRVGQIRRVAYEIEDIVEQFMFEVPEHFHEHRITKFLHRVGHPVVDLIPLHRFASGIAEVHDQIKQIKDSDVFRVPPPPPSGNASTSGVGTASPVAYPISREEELVGIAGQREKLAGLIKGGGLHLAVISVFGQRGSGKTTLLKEVHKTLSNSFELCAWIDVPHPCQSLPEKVLAEKKVPVPQGTDAGQKLYSYLQQRRYLLFLDGICSREDWNYIVRLLPDGYNGSRVIISTHIGAVASYCANPNHNVYDVETLTWTESWKLLCVKAFHGGKCPEHLVESTQNLLKRCERLPMAIVLMGSLLSSKQQSPGEFRKLHDSLGYELGSSADLSIMRRILLRSYYHLSHNLKCCFLYFCNFPEDLSVSRGRLIRLWIAERFIEEVRGKTLEEVAEEYLNDLIQLNLVDVSRRDFEGKVRSCRVQNLVLQFILNKSEEEEFCSVSIGLNPASSKKIRRLSLHDVLTNEYRDKEFSRVRSLMMFTGKSLPESMPGTPLDSFHYLRVLDFEDANLEIFPKEIFILTLLRHLSLRNTKVKTIPKSIKKLQNLVTLDLRQTFITELPQKVLKLQKLIYLLADQREVDREFAGVEVFQGIARLACLEKLSLIKANKKNQGIMKELKSMTKLRKLGISEIKEEDGKDLCKSIIYMEHLYSLHVTSAKEEVLNLDHTGPLHCPIRSLYLAGRLENIPQWIASLNSLAKLCLRGSRLNTSPLTTLQALPSLVELKLVEDVYTGDELVFKNGWFKKLKMLEIEDLEWLEIVEVGAGAMPQLRKLVIRRCKRLRIRPLGTDKLQKLEELLLLEMPEILSLS